MLTRLQKADIAVIVLCLLLALALLLVPLLMPTARAQLIVTDRQGRSHAYSLAQRTTLSVVGEHGHTLTVCIDNGRAFVSESSCPDGLCVACGDISRHGETVVCLPAGIVLRIQAGKAGEADAVLG